MILRVMLISLFVHSSGTKLISLMSHSHKTVIKCICLDSYTPFFCPVETQSDLLIIFPTSILYSQHHRESDWPKDTQTAPRSE